MAQVELTVAGRRYDLACQAGGEAHLRALGEIVDEKVAAATRSLGGLNEARRLLLAALLLADEVAELRGRAAMPEDHVSHAEVAELLGALAERVERVADRLAAADPEA